MSWWDPTRDFFTKGSTETDTPPDGACETCWKAKMAGNPPDSRYGFDIKLYNVPHGDSIILCAGHRDDMNFPSEAQNTHLK